MGFLTSKVGIYLVLIVVGLIALAVVSRNWSCRTPRDRPDRTLRESMTVAKVVNGARIEVEAGRKGRKTRIIQLSDISVPAGDEDFSEKSRKNLELSACGSVRVEKTEGRRRGNADLIGVVYGASGINLNLDQIEHGFAVCLSSAPKEWKAAQKTAKKNQIGIWEKKHAHIRWKVCADVWDSTDSGLDSLEAVQKLEGSGSDGISLGPND